MRLPSFDKLMRDAIETFVRFPFVIASGTFAALAIMSHTNDPRYAMVGFLGNSFLLAIAIFTERRAHGRAVGIVASLIGVALLVAYFFTLSSDRINRIDEVDGIRYILFAAVAHLLVAFAPFTGRDELNGFWQYNKTLFLRILSTALFTGVLYLGLALALLAIHELFNVEWNNNIYGDLFAALSGIFATWFFLAGVPREMATLEGATSYPQGLKVFTQYVLLPLVVIYLVILYLYAGKIILAWELPNGWVSALVLGLAVVGILSLLLLYPIRNLEGNAWIRRFNAWFYWLMIPLVVLLFLAIGRRVADYGITEQRYFVLALAIWLAAITLIFSIGRRDNIKLIPISLALVVFLSSFGPWGAFDVSAHSQMDQLGELLRKEKGLVDGRLVAIGDNVSSEAESRIISILSYLEKRRRIPELSERLGLRWTAAGSDDISDSLGIRHSAYSDNPQVQRTNVGTMADTAVTNVRGFDYMVPFTIGRAPNSSEHLIGGHAISTHFDASNTSLHVIYEGDTARLDVARIAGAAADSLRRIDSVEGKEGTWYYTVDPGSITLDGTLGGKPLRVILRSFETVREQNKPYRLESASGIVLVSARADES